MCKFAIFCRQLVLAGSFARRRFPCSRCHLASRWVGRRGSRDFFHRREGLSRFRRLGGAAQLIWEARKSCLLLRLEIFARIQRRDWLRLSLRVFYAAKICLFKASIVDSMVHFVSLVLGITLRWGS